MDETYGTCVDDECFDIQDYDDDTDHDTNIGMAPGKIAGVDEALINP